MKVCEWSHGLQVLHSESCFPSNTDTCGFPCRAAGRRERGLASDTTNLPIPRLVLLVLRGLVLACVAEPVLTVVLAVFLPPEETSLCLAVAPALPAGLEVAGGAAPCCFLA